MLVHALRRALCVLALPILFAVEALGQGPGSGPIVHTGGFWSAPGMPPLGLGPWPTPPTVIPEVPEPCPTNPSGVPVSEIVPNDDLAAFTDQRSIDAQGNLRFVLSTAKPLIGNVALHGEAARYLAVGISYGSNVEQGGIGPIVPPNSQILGGDVTNDETEGSGGGFFAFGRGNFVLHTVNDEVHVGANPTATDQPLDYISGESTTELRAYGRDDSMERFYEIWMEEQDEDTEEVPGWIPSGVAEMWHTDGTIVHLEDYTTPVTDVRAYRIDYILDPMDNKVDFTYSGNRLASIRYPNGIVENWDYTPSSWEDGEEDGVSGIDVTYTGLPGGVDPSWAMIFQGEDTFVDGKLKRIYYPKSEFLPTPTAGSLFNTASASNKFVVYEFEYNGSHGLLEGVYQARTSSINPSEDLTAIDEQTLAVTYSRNMGAWETEKVISQTLSLHGEETTFDYALFSTGPLVEYIIETSPLTTVTTTKLDVFGRPVSIKVAAATTAVGKPRANESDPPNKGPGGANLSTFSWSTEPSYLEWLITYEGMSCSCVQTPKTITDPSGRVTSFEYYDTTGLLKKITQPSPTGSGTVDTEFEWKNGFMTPGSYPGYQLTKVATPVGDWVRSITFVDREDSTYGKKVSKVKTESPTITLESTKLERSESFNDTDPTYPQSKLVGQLLGVQYGDFTMDDGEFETTYEYDSTYGLLEGIVTNSTAGGAIEVTTGITTDRWGRTTQLIRNSGTSHANQIDVGSDWMRGVETMDMTVGSQAVDTRIYRDRWGNVAVVLRSNQDSSGGEPDLHGGTGEEARDDVRTEFHYEGSRLIARYDDRRSLDRNTSGTVADATDARMLFTGYSYRPDGLLDFITLPNGATRKFVFDGYGTLYRVIDEDDAASKSVSRGYFYYNKSLELMAVFEGATSTPLWTSYDRNGAGFITEVNEPKLVSGPTGYSGSLGGARHELTYDSMGRVTLRESYDDTTLLAKSTFSYDEAGRLRNRKDYALGAGLTGNDYFETSIKYEAGKWTRIDNVTTTGDRVIEYDYDNANRIKEIRDDDGSNPNKRVYTYHSKTNFLSKIESKLYDDDPGVATLKNYVTEYDVDELGRVTEIRNAGTGSVQNALTHEFTYYSLGFTETYTDPLGKVTRYLPDALGRLVEAVEVADSEDIVNSVVYTDWTSNNVNRTLVERYDGRDRLTVTHFDYASRPFLVQTPGADLESEPTLTDPYQKFSRLLKYDEASRVTNEYVAVAWDGEEEEFTGIETRYFYDGPGRLIVQETPNGHAALGASDWSTRDEYRRDALGRITDLIGYAGNIATPWATHQVQFDEDSLGRIHEERYLWSPAFAGTNVIEIASGYNAASNKTDLFRDTLSYSNGLDLTFTPDAVHRIAGINWDGGEASDLADYNHMGSRTSFRKLTYGNSERGETDFDFDDYGRLESILDETIVGMTTTEIAGFDYVYDAAGNLIKEVYDKQGGAVGDRFDYDGFHRLLDGWLGVDSTTMNMATVDPEDEDTMFVQRLTYSLDDANNRDWVNIQDGPEEDPETEDYATQDLGTQDEHQGPSNRYQAVASTNLLYDYRGNLIYDERNSLAYAYDFKNRLSEVFSVSMSLSASSGSSTGLVSSAHLYEPDAIYRAQAEIKRNSGGPEEILKNHGRPEWQWRLSAPLRTGDRKEDEEPKEGGGLEPPPSGPSVGEGGEESFGITLTLIAVYVHDGFNRRVVRSRLGEATYMSAYDGWREVEECVKSGSSTVPIKQFVWGERLDEQIAYREWDGSWQNYFIHNGGQDSITRIVDEDGDVVEIKEYDPFGIETNFNLVGGGTLNPYSWKGHRLDPETGLIYMRNRYYSPELGRFMTHDPLGVWADGLNLGNGYAYGANAPQVHWDPLGLQGSVPAKPTYNEDGTFKSYVSLLQDSNGDWFFVDIAKLANAAARDGTIGPNNTVPTGMSKDELIADKRFPKTKLGPLDQASADIAKEIVEAGLADEFLVAYQVYQAGEIIAGVCVTTAVLSSIAIQMAKNWRSVVKYGHTFSRHGAGVSNTMRLKGRAAGTGQPQGQWLNNEKAAELIDSLDLTQGIKEIDIPEGLGQLIMPDGTIMSATRARIVAGPGGARTAFPIR